MGAYDKLLVLDETPMHTNDRASIHKDQQDSVVFSGATMISNQIPSNWQWVPGMRAYRVFSGDRMSGTGADEVVVHYRILETWVATKEAANSSYGELDEGQTYLDVIVEGGEETYISIKGLIPDFSDPSTQGCLLALVREVWGPEVSWLLALDDMGREYTAEAWDCEMGNLVVSFSDSTFSGVLLAALKAHGKKTC
jgi:hypothetical protein